MRFVIHNVMKVMPFLMFRECRRNAGIVREIMSNQETHLLPFLRWGWACRPPGPPPWLLDCGAAPTAGARCAAIGVPSGTSGPPSRRRTGHTRLYFGCRRSDTDYIYEQEVQHACSAGALSCLRTAFSREQRAKVYVQDRIREGQGEATTVDAWCSCPAPRAPPTQKKSKLRVWRLALLNETSLRHFSK